MIPGRLHTNVCHLDSRHPRFSTMKQRRCVIAIDGHVVHWWEMTAFNDITKKTLPSSWAILCGGRIIYRSCHHENSSLPPGHKTEVSDGRGRKRKLSYCVPPGFLSRVIVSLRPYNVRPCNDCLLHRWCILLHRSSNPSAVDGRISSSQVGLLHSMLRVLQAPAQHPRSIEVDNRRFLPLEEDPDQKRRNRMGLCDRSGGANMLKTTPAMR